VTVKERLDKHDREIAAIRKLIHTGMRMIVKQQEQFTAFQNEVRKDIRELANSQKKTDAMLQDLIRSLKGGTNGDAKRKLEL
jgi:hypothetical protein